MSPKHVRRWIASFLLVVAIGPSIAVGGPLLGNGGWWWEKHFEGDGYSRLHYWAPSLYTWRAYHRPVKFDTPADPYPLVPPGGEAYPFKDPAVTPAIPAPGELKKEAPPPMPPAGNRLIEPMAPPGSEIR